MQALDRELKMSEEEEGRGQQTVQKERDKEGCCGVVSMSEITRSQQGGQIAWKHGDRKIPSDTPCSSGRGWWQSMHK